MDEIINFLKDLKLIPPLINRGGKLTYDNYFYELFLNYKVTTSKIFKINSFSYIIDEDSNKDCHCSIIEIESFIKVVLTKEAYSNLMELEFFELNNNESIFNISNIDFLKSSIKINDIKYEIFNLITTKFKSKYHKHLINNFYETIKTMFTAE